MRPFEREYLILDTVRLISDGPKEGKDPYYIIAQQLGVESLEVPDLYDNDHTSVQHLIEDFDDVVGNHFVFLMYQDKVGSKGDYSKGIQRNEIKVYSGSDERLKGKRNQAFYYKWKLKIDSGMVLNKTPTNFFQIRPVHDRKRRSMLVLSAMKTPDKNALMLRHRPHQSLKELDTLGSVDFDDIVGQWMEITCVTQFSDEDEGGFLYFDITSVKDSTSILSINKPKIDMWSNRRTSYVRPKWGIVRFTEEGTPLHTNEERVRISDLEITILPKEGVAGLLDTL